MIVQKARVALNAVRPQPSLPSLAMLFESVEVKRDLTNNVELC